MSSPFDDLLLSDEFQSLLQRKETFNPFKVLRVHRKELAHSNLLAFFFNPKSAHGCGSATVKAFLQDVVSHKQEGFTLSEFLGIDFSEVIVRREHFYIDLVLEFPLSKTVIAIENKVDAGEGGQQIKRYQETIEKHYAHYTLRKIFYLTPQGISSNTVDPTSSVDCLPVSYRSFLSALESVNHLIAKDVACFFEQTLSHIKESILKEGPEQQLMKDIWANPEYAEALQELLAHRPNLDSLRKDYEAKITVLCVDNWKLTPNFSVYPRKRGALKEIRFQFEEWNKKGVPITFMFYQYDYNPAFRVLVYKNHYLNHEASLVDFATKHKSEEISLDTRFSAIGGWSSWRKVYSEDDYPNATYCDQVVCNLKTLEWAIEQAVEQVNRLKPLVDKF